MAILIVEHHGTVEGASLSGRVLIGRRGNNHVVVDEPAVSRIHAWIDTADDDFCLTDAGSRTGTFVNGQRVSAKVALRHGDRIAVGSASLIFRTDGSLPAGVAQLDFGDVRPPAADGGILFDCACGAPLWISSSFAGRLGKCRFCGDVVRIPRRPHVVATDDFVAPAAPLAVAPTAAAEFVAAVAPPVSRLEAATVTTRGGQADAPPADACGACQSPIDPADPTTVCPACGLTFHADCWAENLGCSAYGCSQVNALAPEPDPAVTDASPDDAATPLAVSQAGAPGDANGGAAPASRIPPEYALLAGSVAGLLLGAFTFGVPALLALVAASVHLRRQRARGVRRANPVALAAAGLALVGVAAGATISYYWWVAGATPALGWAHDFTDGRRRVP